MRAEIINDLKRQSEALSQYSNDMSGFKISLKKSERIDLNIKNLKLEEPVNIVVRVRYYFHTGKWVHAYTFLNLLPQEKRSVEIKLLMAKCLYMMELYDRAEESVLKITGVISSRSELSEATRLSLLICAERNGRGFKEKWKLYLKVRSGDDSRYLYALGKKLFFRGSYNLAAYVFTGIDRKHINYFRGRFFKVGILVHRNNIPAAIMELKEIEMGLDSYGHKDRLIVRQLYDQINIAMARSYYETGRYRMAIERYNKISRKSKKFNEVLVEIAWCFHKIGKDDLARNIIEGIKFSENQNKTSLDAALLRAEMYAAGDEREQAFKEYEEIEKNYYKIRKRVVDMIENNESMPDMFKLFGELSREKELIGKREHLLNEWLEFRDMIGLTRFFRSFDRVNRILQEVDKSLVMMTEIKDKLMEKRDFMKNFKTHNDKNGNFTEFGRRLYEIIQDVKEREQYILCMNITEEECRELKSVSTERYRYFKKNIIDEKVDDEKMYQKFKEFQIYLNREDDFLIRARARNKIDNIMLKKIDSIKNRYAELNRDFLEIRDWIKTRMMNKFVPFDEKLRQFEAIKRQNNLVGRKLVMIIYNEIMRTYTKMVRRMNQYHYNVMLGKNEILWKIKNKYAGKYLAVERKKMKNIKSLKNSYREVFRETD